MANIIPISSAELDGSQFFEFTLCPCSITLCFHRSTTEFPVSFLLIAPHSAKKVTVKILKSGGSTEALAENSKDAISAILNSLAVSIAAGDTREAHEATEMNFKEIPSGFISNTAIVAEARNILDQHKA